MAQRSIICLFGLLLLTILAYGRLGSEGFVYEDRNPLYGLAADAPWPDYRIPWAGWRAELSPWIPQYKLGRVGPTPRLLSTLSYRLNMWADATPRGFHLTNLAIHLVNGVLLYAVALPFGSSVALMATMLFLLHPLNSEAVSYVSARPDLLYATAILLMLLSARSDTWGRIGLTMMCGALAVLAKESAIVVIGLLPLWLWFIERWSPRWWLPLGVWLTGGLAVVYRLVHVSASAGAAHPWAAIAAYTSDAPHGVLTYAAYQALALVRMLGLLIGLHGFSIDPDIEAHSLLVASASLVLLVSLAVLAWQCRHASSVSTFAIGWLLVSLSLRFVWPMPEYLHEQHSYVPFLGLWIALAAAAVSTFDWLRDWELIWTPLTSTGEFHGRR